MSPAVLKGLVQSLITVSQFFLNNRPGVEGRGGCCGSSLICTSRDFSLQNVCCGEAETFLALHMHACTVSGPPGSPPAASPTLVHPPPPHPSTYALNPICSVSLSSAGTKLEACSHKNTSHFQGIGCAARLETSFILANFSIIFLVVETCKKCKNQ